MDRSLKFDIIKKAVNAADLCGLLEIGAPFDEYDLEAARIAKAVNDGDTAEKIAGIACEIFSKAFSREISIGSFEELAREIWTELNKVN